MPKVCPRVRSFSMAEMTARSTWSGSDGARASRSGPRLPGAGGACQGALGSHAARTPESRASSRRGSAEASSVYASPKSSASAGPCAEASLPGEMIRGQVQDRCLLGLRSSNCHPGEVFSGVPQRPFRCCDAACVALLPQLASPASQWRQSAVSRAKPVLRVSRHRLTFDAE